MSTSYIVSLLIEERSRLQAAIDALKGTSEPDPHNVPDWVLAAKAKTATAPLAPKKRTISAASRRRMAEGQKRRWATINAAKSEAVAPKTKAVKATIAEVIAPGEDAEFKSKMSLAMAKSWAKRKAANSARSA